MSSENDRVIVLIQLHGGNDGLNTLIPVEQYSDYVEWRANIAIPPIDSSARRKAIALDNTLPIQEQVGLHPDMIGVKELYDRGKAAIIHSVGHPNMNGSHFRSRDIWYMGGDYDDQLGSGWAGRYLQNQFPTYPEGLPDAMMPDPPALEIGRSVNLLFHTGQGIPIGIAINNPGQFFDLVNSVGGEPPESIINSYYGQELLWIMGIEEKSNQYAGRLKEVYDNGSNSGVIYPEKYPFVTNSAVRNPLTSQLRMIARLLDGGIKTKIFLAKIGGFDTHADQVVDYDRTMGHHAALLYHISSAVKSFQDDLRQLGLEDRVLTMTFSEFGRRVSSNGSYGTDHGKAAPMFVFGKGVNAGVFGSNPDISPEAMNRARFNIPFELGNSSGGVDRIGTDYRSVFKAALKEWMEAPEDAIADSLFNEVPDLEKPLIGGTITSVDNTFFENRFRLNHAYPNPANDEVTLSYYINNVGHVKLSILTAAGKLIRDVVDERQGFGLHEIKVDISDLPTGAYLYRLETSSNKATKKLIKTK